MHEDKQRWIFICYSEGQDRKMARGLVEHRPKYKKKKKS